MPTDASNLTESFDTEATGAELLVVGLCELNHTALTNNNGDFENCVRNFTTFKIEETKSTTKIIDLLQTMTQGLVIILFLVCVILKFELFFIL